MSFYYPVFLSKQLVNQSTRKFVTSVCQIYNRLTISYHFFGKNRILHPEKTLHFLKQITLKSVQKPTSRATLQPTVNQMVINPQSKRGFIGLQKGVSKTSKGHLLQAKRALIRMELTPFLVTRFEFSLRLKVYRRHNKHKTA